MTCELRMGMTVIARSSRCAPQCIPRDVGRRHRNYSIEHSMKWISLGKWGAVGHWGDLWPPTGETIEFSVTVVWREGYKRIRQKGQYISDLWTKKG
ncbi:hypothetical protein CEXT_714411 [Caerostris extrusa]|uniref:Uncharacterized protein n=1 Tax=Caerostris extrusa TaxID=172846 RepID=A0AAV4U129_CAEEX|nr:hypothetical protein CEXT_714411 [Caerostris extrusa]